MPKQVNPDSNNAKVYLKEGQKAKLQAVAESYGCNTISQFISNIAEGKLQFLSEDAMEMLAYIRYTIRSGKK
jgi:hypothetical protein